jgi:hypothetical protein
MEPDAPKLFAATGGTLFFDKIHYVYKCGDERTISLTGAV